MKRELGIDLARAIAALGIVFHHFAKELSFSGAITRCFFGGDYASGSFGWFFVTWFFIISGASLEISHPVIKWDFVIRFYKKRWLSIFPTFYLVYLLKYISNAMNQGRILLMDNPKSLIWSILGLDGFIGMRVQVYALTGEWFLGAIILIYILYPAFSYLFNKNRYMLGILLVVLLLFVDYYNLSIQNGPFRSLTSCLFSFYCGMVLSTFNHRINNNIIALVCLIFTIPFFVFPINIIDSVITVHILGIISIIPVWWLGNRLNDLEGIKVTFLFISGLSYECFLLQHIIINDYIVRLKGTEISLTRYIFNMFVCTGLILFYSWLLHRTVNYRKPET